MDTTYKPCQCEHCCHFHDKGRKLSPNGNPSHRYGIRFHTLYLVTVKTDRGAFTVCKDCAEDCHADSQSK